MTQPKTILILGAFDSKGPEYALAIQQIHAQGMQTLTVNFGTLGSTDRFVVDIEADRLARLARTSLAQIREHRDRGEAMQKMGEGAAQLVEQLLAEKRIDGIFGMGGTGGTSVITTAMRALPLGFPKLCLSTAGGGNVSPYVGIRDIVLFPSVVDVSGINRISREIISRAAGAICGMVRVEIPDGKADRPQILASMFGNTTQCVDHCRGLLETQGYEVLVFHAVGTGGRALEDLVQSGYAAGVLDITTTEWADELCGGIFSAGKGRLDSPGQKNVPHLIVPGCIDMVNYGGIETVPVEYEARNLYRWNPEVTLMRTSAAENIKLGRIFAEKANAARGPVGFLIPTEGFSILGAKGENGTHGRFYDPAADQAFITSLQSHLRPGIPVEQLAMNINDPRFSERAVAMLLELMADQGN